MRDQVFTSGAATPEALLQSRSDAELLGLLPEPDADCRRRKRSPGGCADLLRLTRVSASRRRKVFSAAL